jgi:hypothetical protein
MRNLLERLKPEYLELLEADGIKYPFLVQGIKNVLIKNFSYISLDVYTANQLCTVSNVKFGILELDNLFIKDGKE